MEIGNNIFHENHILSKITTHCSTRKSVWPLVSKSWLNFYNNSYKKKLKSAKENGRLYLVKDVKSHPQLMRNKYLSHFNKDQYIKFGFNFDEILHEYRDHKLTKKIQTNRREIGVYLLLRECDFVSDIKFLDPMNKISKIIMEIGGRDILEFEKEGEKWVTDKFKPPYSPLPLIFLQHHDVKFFIYFKEPVESVDVQYKRYNISWRVAMYFGSEIITIFDDKNYVLINAGMMNCIL